MDNSYIISTDIEEKKEKEMCIHDEDSEYYEKKIKQEDNIFTFTYTCLKCNEKFITKWTKIGRFFHRNVD